MAQDHARGFYNGRRWETTRAAYMANQYYICERCGGPAKVVHHIVHLTPENIGDPNIALHWDNLEALCQDCHNEEHNSPTVCAEGLRFNKDGELIQVCKLNASED